MRKTKVKLFKKQAVVALSVIFLTAGVTFAESWDSFQGRVNAGGTVNVTEAIDAPPPPPVPTTLNGNGAIVDGTGYTGSIINNTNAGVTLTIKDTSFANGSSAPTAGLANGGGAIYNDTKGTLQVTSDKTGTERPVFSNNTASNGGAINNKGVADIKNIRFENNKVNYVGADPMNYGGAIINNGILTVTGSLFQGNEAGKVGLNSSDSQSGYGGALMNVAGTATINNSVFEGNKALYTNGRGGAILNAAEMTINSSNFTNNTATTVGGAIANGATLSGPSGETLDSDAILTINGGSFVGNNANGSGAGAIHNMRSYPNYEHIVNIKGGTIFSNNYTSNGTVLEGNGGAILNEGTLDPITAKDAILNIDGSDGTVIFRNNAAGTYGGAIQNQGIANINYALFEKNGTLDSDFLNNNGLSISGVTEKGGAISNVKESDLTTGQMTIRNSTFRNNQASSQGGAIYNNGDVTIIDSDFVGNKAGSGRAGGAIYSTVTSNADSNVIIRAQSKDVNIGQLSDSIDLSVDSIQIAGTDAHTANLNLQAVGGRTININTEISTADNSKRADGSYKNNVNIGDVVNDRKTYTGTVRVNKGAKIDHSVININSGSLSFAKDHDLAVDNIVNMNGGTLDLLNRQFVNQMQARELNMLADSKIRLDVDLANETMDQIRNGNTVVTNDGGYKLTVSEMYSKSDMAANKNNVDILFTDAQALTGNKVIVGENAKIIQSPTTKYAVTKYEKATGGTNADGTEEQGVYFGFSRMGTSDPGISGPVAAQAAFLLMDNLYRQSFANMDMVTLMTPEQRMAWKMRNRYANAGGYHRGVYAPNVLPEERDGLYVRPFSNFESVSLKNGPKVSNVSYGSLIGGESDIIDLGHGWDGNFSLFGAYHGSHQAYNGVDIWQNGGTIGGVATAYKGNFFTGLTANIGASAAEARHGFGNDQFPILMTGAAWKSGYNFGFNNNKVVLQPSYMMSYTFVNVFDYNSSSGARISQDPLNAIEIIPGLKLIGNFKNGWQPYAACNMTWNIMDKTKFYANEVALAQLSVKPFFEYGVGMQKRTGDRFTGYGQAMLRSGGRNGVALTLGLRWALGH